MIWFSLLFLFSTLNCVHGDFYFTGPYSGAIFYFNTTTNVPKQLVGNQNAVSFIRTNGNYAFWVSSRFIIQALTSDWEPSVFVTTAAKPTNPILAITVDSSNVFWSIGNQIFQQKIGDVQNPVLLYTSPTSYPIFGLAVSEEFSSLFFSNYSASSIYMIDLSSTELDVIAINYGSQIQSICGNITQVSLSSTQILGFISWDGYGHTCSYISTLQNVYTATQESCCTCSNAFCQAADIGLEDEIIYQAYVPNTQGPDPTCIYSIRGSICEQNNAIGGFAFV